MQRQANGETMAHCVYLELEGRVERSGADPARFWLAGAGPGDGDAAGGAPRRAT